MDVVTVVVVVDHDDDDCIIVIICSTMIQLLHHRSIYISMIIIDIQYLYFISHRTKVGDLHTYYHHHSCINFMCITSCETKYLERVINVCSQDSSGKSDYRSSSHVQDQIMVMMIMMMTTMMMMTMMMITDKP
jgi:hypothetical protein